MRGITLLAIGHPTYGKLAYNMRCSILKHSPNIPVQLVCDDKAISHLNEYAKALFEITKIEREDTILTTDINGRPRHDFSPAKAKLNIYKYLKYDETIYLDVDGILLKDITPLFDEAKQSYHAQTSFSFLWLEDKEVLKSFFGVEEVKRPINSSFQYIKKSKKAEKLFDRAAALIENPLPLEKQTTKWYFGQPDELYMNIALEKEKIDPQLPSSDPMFCKWKSERTPCPSLSQITGGHYVIGFWGHPTQVSVQLFEYYDKLMRNYLSELFSISHVYKIRQLLNLKR